MGFGGASSLFEQVSDRFVDLNRCADRRIPLGFTAFRGWRSCFTHFGQVIFVPISVFTPCSRIWAIVANRLFSACECLNRLCTALIVCCTGGGVNGLAVNRFFGARVRR